jgi:hypothetical protein
MIPGYIKIFRQRPTLPHSLPCSTIGAKELNFRVRDGNGCFLFAIATEKTFCFQGNNNLNISTYKCSKRLCELFCGQASRPISTGKLNTLLCLHIRPINLVVYKGSSAPVFPRERDILS